MPRVRITSSWPIASTAITAVCVEDVADVPVVKKNGVDRLDDDHEREQDQRRPQPEQQQSQAERAEAQVVAG